MIHRLMTGALVCLALFTTTHVKAQAVVGQPAPAFTAADATGAPISLADFAGKFVVLEWVNPNCPFSQKHYHSGNMSKTQKHAIDNGAVWLSVQTTDTKGHDDEARTELQSWLLSQSAAPTAAIVDATGTVARAYGARTTPHMYVVDPKGVLVYAGAIDSTPSANADDIPTATNYVTQALDEVMAGKAVSRSVTQPYGCAVKYPSQS